MIPSALFVSAIAMQTTFHSPAKFWETLGVFWRCFNMLCRSQESIRPGSLWKVMGSVAWVRCWRHPGTGRQFAVFLLRRLRPFRESEITTVHRWCWTLFIVNISGSQPFRWKEPNPNPQFCWRASLNFLTQFNLHVLFYSRTKSLTQNIRRFIERMLRATQRVPGSRIRPSEQGLRTTGQHELDRQSQPSRKGCHSSELQDEPFTLCRQYLVLLASSQQSSACIR